MAYGDKSLLHLLGYYSSNSLPAWLTVQDLWFRYFGYETRFDGHKLFHTPPVCCT